MNKIKLMIITLLLLILFLTSCRKIHISEDFKKLVEQNYIIESTVLIIKEESSSQNNGVNLFQYSNGFSGVIFNKKINKYYVLTAYHTIESFEGNLYVLFWDVSRYNDLNAQEKNGIGRYYESKPKATIEYTNIEFDLAILSFESEDTLPTLEFSDLDPNYGDEVIVISNP